MAPVWNIPYFCGANVPVACMGSRYCVCRFSSSLQAVCMQTDSGRCRRPASRIAMTLDMGYL